MTFAEYQTEALKTAKFKDEHALPYLYLGLISEVGEVAGKVKKWIRDQGASPALLPREAIADELGDVLWYVAVLAHYESFELDETEKVISDYKENYKEVPLDKFLLNRLQGYIAELNEGCLDLKDYVEVTCRFGNLIGFTLEDIMTRNIDKLRSRQERGVIGGSGDNR